jgi:hypothetical protein
MWAATLWADCIRKTSALHFSKSRLPTQLLRCCHFDHLPWPTLWWTNPKLPFILSGHEPTNFSSGRSSRRGGRSFSI